MKVRKNVLISIILFFALGLAQLATPSAAFASGTVGNGTPGSCTEGALDSALAGGGAVNFDCGAAPHTITITGTKVISSTTQINGGGLITISGGDAFRVFTVNAGVNFTMTGLTVSDGYNVGNGGGMFIDSGATVTVTTSTFKDNNVLDGYGGAIYVNDAALDVFDSSFITNNADVTSIGSLSLGGGAIQNNDGTVKILGSTFNGNTVTSPSADGGAIYNGDFDGGPGIPDGNADSMEIGNSTFYNNTLVGDEGTSGSSGGAIRSNGDITLAHNTFSNNDSGVTMGSGEESGAVTFGHGTAVVVYNIFANSTSFSGAAYDCAKRTSVTSLIEIGSLVESDFSCDGTYNTDPNLGPFQDNGGPTFTMAPVAPSDAIHNAGNCADGITTDQRGVSRPQPNGPTFCDLGAVEVDDTAPTATITKAGGQADPTNGSPVNFTVTFSEPVVGFTSDDLNLSASTVGGTPTGAITGGPTVFNVAITGMTTPGDIVLSIDADVLTDIALNGNDASTSPDNIVAYDATGPIVTLEQAVGQNDPTNDSLVDFTVVFDEAVTGFTAADVTIGGTAGPTTKNVSGSGDTYNVAVGGMTGDGTVTASIIAGAVNDSLGNPNLASTSSDNIVSYDGTAPAVSSITVLDANPTNAASVQFLVTFSENVNGTGTASNYTLTQTGVTGASITDVTGTGTTRTVTVGTGSGNGTIRLNMANSTGMADDAGNAVGGLPFNDEVYTVDKSAPTVLSINRVSGTPTNASSVDFLVTFSESVNGGSASNFALTPSGVSGASISGVTGTGATRTVTVSTGSGNGTIRLDLDNSAGLADAAGNTVSNVPFTTGQSYDMDRTAPTVTIEQKAGQNDPTNDSPIEFTVVFSESVSDFATADLTLSSGTAVVTGGPASYNVAVSGMSQGVLTVSIPANAAVDAAGNNSDASTSADNSVLYDSVAPTVTIDQKAGQTDPTNASPIEFTVEFSEDVAGFTNADVSLSSGTALVTGGPAIYNVAVSGMNQGTLTATVPSNAATDVAGNNNGVSSSTDNSVSYDSIAPTILSITRLNAGTTNAASVQFLVTFNESLTGGGTSNFALTQNGVSGASIDTVTGSGTTRTVTVNTGTGDGTIRLDMANSTGVADAAGNAVGNVPFTTGQEYTIDKTGPSVTIIQSLLQNDPTNESTIDFTVVFSESVNDFATGDVTLSGTAGATTATVTGTGTTYNVAVTGMTANGTVIASIASAVATDAVGNSNAGSTSTDNTVTYDTVAPTVTIEQAASQPDPTNELTIDFTVVFSEAVTNFVTGDVTLSGTAGATSATVTGGGTTYNVAVENMTQNGSVIAAILAGKASDAAGNLNAASNSTDNTVIFDAENPTVTINQAVGQADPTGFSPANFTVVFSKTVAGFETGDVLATGTSNPTTATVTETGPLDGTTYNVVVSGMTSSGTATVSIPGGVAQDTASNVNLPSTSTDDTVTFVFVKPGVPALTAPANGVIVTGLQPLLNWNDSNPGAQYYQIQVSTVNTFATTVINETNIAVSEFTPAANLTPGVRYYWRVRALNAIGTASAWSTVRNFRTPLQTPVLASPIGGVVLDIDRPTFDWNDIPGAANYTLQISTAGNFSTGLITKTAPGSSYVMPSDLVQKKVLYWRVKAKTPVVSSAWSATQSFKTGNPPTVPVLATPATNAGVTILNPLFNWGNSTLPLPASSTIFKYYQLQVADNADFNTPVIDKQVTGITSSQYRAVDPDDGLVPDKKYYWRVRAVSTTSGIGGVDQFSAWSKVFTFRSAMAKPVLVAPDNTTTPALVTRRPAFDWQDTTGTTSYQIQISVFANMSTPLVNVNVPSSEYTPATDLPANKALFWRVRAKGPNGPSLWTAAWTFKTGNPPSVPVLLAPANNALSTIEKPVFDWGNSTVPTGTLKHYEIEVDDDNAFGSPAIHEFTPPADSRYLTQLSDTLNPNTTYYWRVRAVSTIGLVDHTSSWSTVRKLRMALTAPVLIAPADGATITSQPIFDWDEVPDATGYTIQVSTSATFSTLLVNASRAGGTNTSYDPTVNLPLNKTLYWRVRANGTNTSAWTIFDFKITP